MITATLPTIREWNLELSVQADEPDLLQVQCAGDAILPDFRPEKDPLVKLVGPQVYSRKVLLNMEKANSLDTSGISWLISCHECCLHAGGVLVLYAIPPRVRYVLQLLRMEDLLHTAPDLAAARAIALKGG
jgi:ABC-type transporter Mla MlaB component